MCTEGGNNTIDVVTIATFLIAQAVVLIIFFLQKHIEKERLVDSIKREARNTLFNTCDKVIRYSILCEDNNLSYQLFRKLKEINPDNKEIESIYFKKVDNQNESANTRFLLIGDLRKHTFDLEMCMDSIYNEINIELNKFYERDKLRFFNNAFEGSLNTNDKYIELKNGITKHIKEGGMGEPLLKIMTILHPKYVPSNDQSFTLF